LISQRASAQYCSVVGVGRGTGSAPVPRAQLGFVAGSASGVTVTVFGVTVWSIVLVAAFHVPQTPVGGMPVPPYCQSPASWLVLPGGTSKSVMYNDGNMGRPEVSVPPWASVAPTCKFPSTHAGVPAGPAVIG
jgi:hypothetical protein